MTAADEPTLLICTVGGSPEPIVASLKHWRPARVLFVPTRETESQIEATIIPLARQEGLELSPGCYELLPLSDGQDFTACIDRLRELNSEVERWLARGGGYRVVVDYTGGTKCMSAAIAVQAHRWRCLFGYVGGETRTKSGVGVVVSGKEKIVHADNPWDALGFQAIEQAMTLFDQGAYAASTRLLDQTLRNVQRSDRKRELHVLKLLTEAYDAWDRFDHKSAGNRLGEVEKYANDLRALLTNARRAELLLDTIGRHREHLRTLDITDGPTAELVADLLANARRRAVEGRFDDAVARLYRAIEALAQRHLREDHDIRSTSEVPLERVPEPLYGIWAPFAQANQLKLGLQDAFALLNHLGNPVGQRFVERQLADPDLSPLMARNVSILAHGFQPVSEKVCRRLSEAALALAGLNEDDLPTFPQLMIP